MNIYDIAKEAGVSISTVSRVLNNRGNVKTATREKILQIIEKENYTPNLLARNLSVGASRNIAFLVPDIENSFFGKILHGISDCAIESDYNVFMYGTDENTEREHKILSNLRPELICGLIIAPVSERDEETEKLLKNFEGQGMPVVLVDRDLQGEKFDGVFSNDIEGAYNAVECLIREGHKKIAILTRPETARPGKERLKGYKKALEENGIAVDEKYIVSGGMKEDATESAMDWLMQLEEPPTAVFASNNLTALGCLKYLKEHELRLTYDISMVSFDDIEELEYTNVQLTAVSRPVYEMGYEAMQLLKKRLEEERNVPRYIIRRHVVNTGLIKRGSEKCNNKKLMQITNE